MRPIRYTALAALVLLVSGGIFYGISAVSNPCVKTLSYTVGDLDPRFGMSIEQLLAVINETEAVWEEPVGLNLFEYDPSASFKINLVFDERQRRTLEERELKKSIDLSETSYETLALTFHNLNAIHRQDYAEYEANRFEYENRLKAYNDEVRYWNSKGGAPSDIYRKLSDEKKELEQIARNLEQSRIFLNEQSKDLRKLSDKINEMARQLNRDVDAYNGRFGASRRFDQGTYTGKAINIYQFNDESDLRLVLAHELGHALRLNHLNDPKAIMYYLMDQQNLENLRLTETDLAALKEQCGLTEDKSALKTLKTFINRLKNTSYLP
jgi:hypothetical protein